MEERLDSGIEPPNVVVAPLDFVRLHDVWACVEDRYQPSTIYRVPMVAQAEALSMAKPSRRRA